MDEHPHHDLCIVLTYYSPYVSGLTNVARDLAEGLAARGWRVCVVASKHDPELADPRDRQRGRGDPGARAGQGRQGHDRAQPDPARAAGDGAGRRWSTCTSPWSRRGCWRGCRRCPVVSTYHCDVSLPTGDGPLVRRLVNAAQHRAIDFSSRVALRRSAAAVVSAARTTPGTAGCGPRSTAGWSRCPPPCPPRGAGRPTFRRGDGLHVGFLGRIVEEKGVEHLVDAFLALDDPDARLLVGGDYLDVAGGSVAERVRRHIGDDPRIAMLGFIPEEDLDDFYASLDVFALPSVNAFEAFGIVQVVAMMAGVPALVSDLPGVRTVVEETGFGEVVAPRDVPGLTAALARLRDDPPDAAPAPPPRPRATASRPSSTRTRPSSPRPAGAEPVGHADSAGGTVGYRPEHRDRGGLADLDAPRARGPDVGRPHRPGEGRGWLDAGRVPGHRRRRDRDAAGPPRRARRRPGPRPRRRLRLRRGAACPTASRRPGSPRWSGSTSRRRCSRRPARSSTRRRADFRLATGPELDVVEPASADLVYTCRVLQHMPPELAHRYVREFYRIVRPGGYVVFQMPTAPARNAAGLALRALPAPLARPAAARAWRCTARRRRGSAPWWPSAGRRCWPPTRTPAPVRAGARASTSLAPPLPEQDVTGPPIVS